MNELIPFLVIGAVIFAYAINYKIKAKPIQRNTQSLREMYLQSVRKEARLRTRWGLQNEMAYADYSITIPEATEELRREAYYFNRMDTQRRVSSEIFTKIKNQKKNG